MLKTTKHLLALALSAAMLLGSPGMLTAFADNGNDLAMAKSLSVQTMGEDPEENPESNEITIGQSEESTPSLPPANTILQAPTAEIKDNSHPTEVAPGSYLTSSGLTLTYRYIDQKTKESLNDTQFFLDTVPKAEELEDLEYPAEYFSNPSNQFFHFLEREIEEDGFYYLPPPLENNEQYVVEVDGETIVYELSRKGGGSPYHYYLVNPDNTIESFTRASLQANQFEGCELIIEVTLKNIDEPYFEDGEWVTNEIESLTPSVSQNGAALTPADNTQPSTFLIENKENILLTYDATMDMAKVGLYDEETETVWKDWVWSSIMEPNAAKIENRSTVYLVFDFDENVDLSDWGQEEFEKVSLSSSMFKLTGYEVEGQRLTLICNWTREGIVGPIEDSLIVLENVTVPIRSDWEGDSLAIHNDGFVNGYAYLNVSGDTYWRIDGGSKTDEFILKLPDPVTPDPTPDPEPQPEPDPEPGRPSRPSRDDDDDWEPLPDAPVKEKAETVEVETEVPEQTETQTPVQQPEKHNPETGDASFAPVSLALAAASLSAAALLARKRK